MCDLYFTCRSSKRPGSIAFASAMRRDDGSLDMLSALVPGSAIRVVSVINAARAALEAQEDRTCPIVLYTDSRLVVDVLSGHLADAFATRQRAPNDYCLSSLEAAAALYELAQEFETFGVVLVESTHPLIQALSDEATARAEADCTERLSALGFQGKSFSCAAERARRKYHYHEGRNGQPTGNQRSAQPSEAEAA